MSSCRIQWTLMTGLPCLASIARPASALIRKGLASTLLICRPAHPSLPLRAVTPSKLKRERTTLNNRTGLPQLLALRT
jgi:hypothetical protein